MDKVIIFSNHKSRKKIDCIYWNVEKTHSYLQGNLSIREYEKLSKHYRSCKNCNSGLKDIIIENLNVCKDRECSLDLFEQQLSISSFDEIVNFLFTYIDRNKTEELELCWLALITRLEQIILRLWRIKFGISRDISEEDLIKHIELVISGLFNDRFKELKELSKGNQEGTIESYFASLVGGNFIDLDRVPELSKADSAIIATKEYLNKKVDLAINISRGIFEFNKPVLAGNNLLSAMELELGVDSQGIEEKICQDKNISKSNVLFSTSRRKFLLGGVALATVTMGSLLPFSKVFINTNNIENVNSQFYKNQLIEIEKETDIKNVVKIFEDATSTTLRNKNFFEAEIVRAKALEKLYLFEDAKELYIKCISGNWWGKQIAQENLQKVEVITKSLTDNQSSSLFVEFDNYINEFLKNRAISNSHGERINLEKARFIAQEIFKKYESRFHQSIIGYYSGISIENSKVLLDARIQRIKIERNFLKTDFSKQLYQVKKIKNVFDKAGAWFESFYLDALIIKLQILSGKIEDLEKSININLNRSISLGNKFIEIQLIQQKGILASMQGEHIKSRDYFTEALHRIDEYGMKEGKGRLLLFLSTSFAGARNYLKGFLISFKANMAAREENDTVRLARIIQICGLNAMSLNYFNLSEVCFNRSLASTEKNGDTYTTSLTKGFLGLLYSKINKEKESLNVFKSAFENSEFVEDEEYKNSLLVYLNGYYSKANFIFGNLGEAENGFLRALQISEKINLKDNILLSELHQGLGEVYLAKKQPMKAKEELAKAITLDKLARTNYQESGSMINVTYSEKSPYEVFELTKNNY